MTGTQAGQDLGTAKDLGLVGWSAETMAGALAAGEVSAVEVMQAHLDRIEETNPVINAIISQQPDSVSLAQAAEADARRAEAVRSGESLPPLHGLPTAVKDLIHVAGFPTVNGSGAFKDAPIESHDSQLAATLRRQGALIIGKTNTPEMGQGVLSFNPVFGTTVSPWDTSRHAGGSSGGAGAAVAARMLPIADGSDSGGSLRYPAAFNNVVGLRPTPGRVASGRPGDAWSPHGVLGPMARDSRDTAFFLDAIQGPDDVWPMSRLALDPVLWPQTAPSLSSLTIAWSPSGGGLPIDEDVAGVHAAFRSQLAALGATVEDAEPDFRGVDEAWETIETFEFFSFGRGQIDSGMTGFREDYLRNIEQGRAATATQLADAFARRTILYRETARLLQKYDVLILPASPVVAPPKELEWVPEAGGVTFERYFRWQMLANRITVTEHPVAVTAAGFTADGLPVGVQVVGRFGREGELLAATAAIEAATGWIAQTPPEPYRGS